MPAHMMLVALLVAMAADTSLAATSTTTEWQLEFDAPVLAAGG